MRSEVCVNRERTYDATPQAVAAARDFVSAFAVAMLHPRGWSVADDAALVVSELMTSALEAGCGSVGVRIDLHADRLDLQVTGYGVAGDSEADDRLQGLRGAVVQQLATRAELRRTPAGALVGTAQLPCATEWTGRVPCSEPG